MHKGHPRLQPVWKKRLSHNSSEIVWKDRAESRQAEGGGRKDRFFSQIEMFLLIP